MKATNWLIVSMVFYKTFCIDCTCPSKSQNNEFNNLATIVRKQTKITTTATTTTKKSTTKSTTTPTTEQIYSADLNNIFITLNQFKPKCPKWMKTNSNGECSFTDTSA